jgi:hypothetical protein
LDFDIAQQPFKLYENAIQIVRKRARLLNEFLLESGCHDYGAVTPIIIDLMRKAVEERKNKS